MPTFTLFTLEIIAFCCKSYREKLKIYIEGRIYVAFRSAVFVDILFTEKDFKNNNSNKMRRSSKLSRERRSEQLKFEAKQDI